MYFQKERNTDVRNTDQLPLVSTPTGTGTCNLLACGVMLQHTEHRGRGRKRNLKGGGALEGFFTRQGPRWPGEAD